MIAAKKDLEIHQIDVFTAFLGVDLEEEINMHLLQGYCCLVQTGSRYNDPRSNTLCKMILRLRMRLSGLEQSWYVWYGTFRTW